MTDADYWRIDRRENTISIGVNQPAVYRHMDVEEAREVRDELTKMIEKIESRRPDTDVPDNDGESARASDAKAER